MWVVAIVMVVAFGGGYRFPGFCGNQHIRDPTWSQNPFLNRLGNGSRSYFVGFRCFGNTSCSFHFAFICMHVPPCSFHLHAYSFHVAFMSSHFPFILLSCSFHLYLFPFIFLLYSFHLHSNVHSCPVNLPFIGHGSMAWPGDRVQQMVISLSYR